MAGLTQRGRGRRSPHRRGALGTASGRHRAGLLRIQIQRNLINHTFILVCHLNPAPSAGLWGWQNELKEKRGTRGCREHCGVGDWAQGSRDNWERSEMGLRLWKERDGSRGQDISPCHGPLLQPPPEHKAGWSQPAPTDTRGAPPAPSSTAVLGGCRSPSPGWDCAAGMVTHSSKP